MRLLAFSGITGTPTPGTNAVTTTYSVKIPANTFTSNNILQLVWRMRRITGNAGQMTSRIYKNTTNSQVGATQIGSNLTMNGGGVGFVGYSERNFSYDGTNITTMIGTTQSEYTVGSLQSTAFNATSDNWILFTMQASTSLEIANMDMMKVFIYG
jgi:peptidoglycan hydrolase-like protein with peptidoglycan-binding domain